MCLHEQFRDGVRRWPESIAAISWDGQVTYQQLADLFDRFGSCLQAKDIVRGVFVSLCLQNSVASMIAIMAAIMAVLKEGAVCVPLGLTGPTARSRRTVEQFNAKHIIVTPEVVSQAI